MATSTTKLLFAIALAAAVVAAVLSMTVFARAEADAGLAPCVCSAPVDVLTGSLPTSPRASITHCQCGEQSCAVLNDRALECSK